jgi:hypothetical protein
MANMIPISTVTVGSGGAATIDFTNIPQTYTDLLIKVSTRDNLAYSWGQGYIRFNGSTSGYGGNQIYGNGSSIANASGSGNWGTNYGLAGRGTGASTTTNTFSNGEINIPNYAGSNLKAYSYDGIAENNATLAMSEIVAGVWSNTAPISNITLLTPSQTWQQHSTVTLYGIRKY